MSKLYEKRVWVNNQTKLSAKNMNHIEDGLETLANAIEFSDGEIQQLDTEKQEKLVSGTNIKTINGQPILGAGNIELATEGDSHFHDNKEILDQIEVPLTEELTAELNAKSTVSVSDTGTAANKVQYITINGTEYKLAGGDNTPTYSELEGESLDALLDAGIYKLTDALDTPENTSTNGLLNVVNLEGGQVEQEWLSETNRAVRLFDGENAGPKFYVNGVLKNQGIVQLDACGVYELSGELNGCVKIGLGESSVNNRTRIILNGVNIQTSTYNSCIEYTPEAGKLVVEIKDTSENYLAVNLDGETADEDKGAIHSENNLQLQGVGYLSIVNRKGHGIRASELIINGDIHTYLDTNHDAVHGGKVLKITGGYFEVNNANDAFSASAGSNNDGKLLIYGGTYVINACKESAFEGKSVSGVKRILNTNITFGEGVSKLFTASNASAAYQIKVYNGLNTIVNNSTKPLPELINLADEFGEASVLDANENPVQPDGRTFILESSTDTTYYLSGNFSGYKIVTRAAPDVKIDLDITNLYYKDTDISDTDAFIEHDSSATKRLKLKLSRENGLVFISKKAGFAIKSDKNIQITSKGDLIVSCEIGTAIYAPNYTLLSGDGLRSITKSNIGVITNSLRLGEDPEDIADNKYGASDDAIYLIDNTAADVKITDTAFDGAQYTSQIIATQYHTGITVIGTALSDVLDAEINAGSGLVYQKNGGTPYQNVALFYVLTSELTANENVLDYVIPEGVYSEIPELTPGLGMLWTVYAGDGYSKAAADAKFVLKETYDALKAELDSRAPKKINIINYVEDPTKTDHRPNGTGAYAEGKVDKVEVFRWACPDRLDTDTTTKNGAMVIKCENHGSYVKDGRQMYARDGDFGYPEIDGTGQFNFRPVFNVVGDGWCIIPTITKTDGTAAEAGKDYNKFKTPWCTGIPGVYRITKVAKDLNLELHSYNEADMQKHTVTYRIVMPVEYQGERPNVRVFRNEDQLEKYTVYGSRNATPKASKELALGTELIDGKLLTFEQVESADETKLVYEAVDYTYDDTTGLPAYPTSKDDAVKVNFIVEGTAHTDYVIPAAYAEDYVWVASSAPANLCDKVNPVNEFAGSHVTKVRGDITITITIAPPYTVDYTWDNPSAEDKYEFVPKVASRTMKTAPEVGFMWGIKHNANISNEADPRRVEDSAEAKAFVLQYIDSITAGGEPIDISNAFSKIVVKKNEFNVTFKNEVITGDIVITVKTKVLSGITVSNMTTEYEVGDEFTFDGTCTASYLKYDSETVTPTSVSSPDMTTAGEKEVTVSYTEKGITKTAAYTIIVNQGVPKLTITDGSEADDAALQASLIAEKYSTEEGAEGWSTDTNAIATLDNIANEYYTDGNCIKLHYWANNTQFRFGKVISTLAAYEAVKLAIKGDGKGTFLLRFGVTRPGATIGDVGITGSYMTCTIDISDPYWYNHTISFEDDIWTFTLGNIHMTPSEIKAAYGLPDMSAITSNFDKVWFMLKGNEQSGPATNIYIDNVMLTGASLETSHQLIYSTATISDGNYYIYNNSEDAYTLELSNELTEAVISKVGTITVNANVVVDNAIVTISDTMAAGAGLTITGRIIDTDKVLITAVTGQYAASLESSLLNKQFSKCANISLDFEDGIVNNNYRESHWSESKYENNAWVEVNPIVHMNSKLDKNDNKVVNMYADTLARNYLYTADLPTGPINHLSVDLGNYWNDATGDISYKIALIDAAGNKTYLAGSANSWATLAKDTSDGNICTPTAFDFALMSACKIQFTTKTTGTDSKAYLYLDNLVASYVAPQQE